MIIGSLHGIRRTARTDRGLCTKVSDPDTFFSTDASDVKEAKLMCAACPIRQSCLDSALQINRLAGIRGGLTETERRSVLAGTRTLTQPMGCGHCSRMFMPRRGDSKFCTRYCYKQSLRVSQTLPVTANLDDKLDMLAKTG